MNKFCRLIVFFVCAISAASYAQNNKPLRVLMIGNSFSGNASTYLPAITKAGGHQITLVRAEMGGCSLQRHWDSVMVNKADTLRGKPYAGKSLKQILMNGKYDVVSLQQYSMLSADSTTYQPYARYLFDMVKTYQPQAKIVIHETWPYRQDAKTFGQVKGKEHAADQQEMYIKLKAAYTKLTKDLQATIIPSGDAFYKAGNDAVWGFKKDKSFDAAKAVYPALPADSNSLNVGYKWNNEHTRLDFDANHANDAGCYLAGLVWYTVLFNNDPSKQNFRPKGMDETKAAYLQKVALEVVADSKK